MFTLCISDFFYTARESDKSYMINHVVYFGLNNFKLTDVIPVFKKENASSLKNYRSVSVLPVVFYKHLSPNLCGYRKGYSTQTLRAATAVISMLEKWKLFIDNKGFAGGVLIHLSKAFDTNHPLSLAKLNAYGFGKQALAIIICSYLSNRK